MMDKRKLRQAANEAEAALLEGLPAAEACSADFSPAFEQELSRRLAAEKPFSEAVKRVACILLALVLVGGGTLAVSPAARAAVFSGWLWERTGNSILYLFQGKPSADQWGKYSLSNVPEGYVLYKESHKADSGYIAYVNQEGLFFSLDYLRQPKNGASVLAIDEIEKVVISKVAVRNVPGTFYECVDGTSANVLVWEENGVLFVLIGWFDLETLMTCANCINLVK